MLEFKGYRGLLFVGDPHLWSRAPGERLDQDGLFTQTVLNKIEQAVNIAIKENLYLIFLGDLFHKENESNVDLFTKLIRILRKLPEAPATVEGNHEKSQLKLSDDVALSMLREAGVIYTMEKNELWGKFVFTDNTQCYVGATPYGEKIPQEASIPAKEKAPDNTPIIWLTHHDLDFGDSYPGVIAVKEIKGVSMLVNGHIHKTKKSLTLGKMRAHNPGNITRLSKDCHDHVPSVWQWLPTQNFELEPIVLSYQKDIFKRVEEIKVIVSPEQVVDEITPQQTIQFVEKMHQHMQSHDPAKTDDGVHVKNNIRALAKAMNLDDEFTQEILSLADESIEDSQDK